MYNSVDTPALFIKMISDCPLYVVYIVYIVVYIVVS